MYLIIILKSVFLQVKIKTNSKPNRLFMKKFYLLTVLVAFTLSISAQQLPQLTKPTPDAKAPFTKRSINKADEVGWFVPAWDLLENFYGGTSLVTHYANVLFPDSTVTYISGGTLSHNWLTSVGCVLDPYSDFYTDPIPYGAPYFIDSMFVLAWYEKVAQTASYTDTLVVEFVWGERDPLSNPPFRSVYIPGTDTMWFAAPSMAGSTAQYGKGPGLTWAGKYVVKYPLTMTDTTMEFGKYIEFPIGTSLPIPAACITGVNVTFVPGYPYTFGDTVFTYGGNTGTKNAFRVGLYSTTDDVTNPDLFYDPYGYFNLAYMINKSGRYSTYTNALLNQIMYPLTDWGFDIGFKLSANTGVQKADASKINIYPNPANSELNIQLANDGSAQIQIINLVGKVVKDIQTSNMLSTIQISDLAQGMYLVKIVQGEKVFTSKVLVK